MIEQGQIVLPRFQRHEAWKHAQIVGLFENILRKPPLPVGVLLILEIGNDEPFLSRPIVGAPAPSGRPNMHLLDGQQRMTALWRGLTDNYDDLTLLAALDMTAEPEEGADEGAPQPDLPLIERVKRWDRKGVRQPVWVDNPPDTYARGRIPLSCFRPGRGGEKKLEEWLSAVRSGGHELSFTQLSRIHELRQRVASYMVPFLSLGVETSRETALDVFIKMNTSASPLKDFDIVVAQLEEAAGQSLHEKVAELFEEVPAAKEFGRIEDILLSVAALIDGRPPLKKTYLEKDFGGTFAKNWPRIMNGFRRGLTFLREEAIFNDKCVPTYVAVYLLCALWADIREDGFDDEGYARSMLRKVLWRCCFTDRYGKTSATRSFMDYRTIKELLQDRSSQAKCELFDEELYRLPEPEELKLAGWPGRRDRLPRAILATSLRAGGHDFASGAKVNPESVTRREFHHIYPVHALGGNRDDDRVSCALNCALISWATNRKIAASSPKQYIEERARAASLGESEVRHRLASHLIPYEALVSGDYEAFLNARANVIAQHMRTLCDGSIPTMNLQS